jgi:L-lactate dehydrogenase
MKVAIIGGAGRVGATTAFALQQSPAVRQMVLIDVNREGAEGEALDLGHGASLGRGQRLRAGELADAAGCELVIITAGVRRKAEESRLELVNRNVSLFRQILEELGSIELGPGAIVLVVTNPVDILTQLAARQLGWPAGRILGTGTLLDTVRIRSLIGEHLGVEARQVSALILGEHGDSMVPVWSSASVNGVALSSFPGFDAAARQKILKATRQSGAEVIRLKGGAAYAIALVVKEIVEAIGCDRKSVLPVSTPQRGLFGISDVSLSLPTRLGRGGAEEVIAIQLTEEERVALLRSAVVLKETLVSLAR